MRTQVLSLPGTSNAAAVVALAVLFACTPQGQRFGGLVATAPQDTARPPMPDSLGLPVDSVLTVTRRGDTLPVYYRTFLAVGFIDGTSGGAIRRILRRHRASIIGGAPYSPPNGEYIIRVPDPGTSFSALDSLARAFESEAGVDHVGLLSLRDIIDVRYKH